MARIGRGRRQLSSPIWRASVEEEVDAELAFHVEMRTREYIANGMDPDAARAAAIAKFGNIGYVNAECRTIGHSRERVMERTEYFNELVHDVRFALRQLLKTPAFTIIAVLTLALGIGATTAIFSAVQAVVLRPFPFARPDELVFVFSTWNGNDGGAAIGNYADWRARATSFANLAAIGFTSVTISEGDAPLRTAAARVTANMFPMYGVQPAMGRVFTADEDVPGRDNVVVLSDAFWRSQFGSDRGIVGKTLTINGRPRTVIGVMPPSFDPTDSHESLWLPAAFTPQQLAFHDEHGQYVVGRLKPAVTIAAAQREMEAVSKQMALDYPKTNTGRGAHVQRLADAIIGDYHDRLLVLLGAVACVLLIACGNVANLLLARGAARAKELAIRSAIGAGRGRILRQLLTESFVLALLATVAGILLAWLAIHLLIGAAPANIPRLADTRVNGVVLAFALGLSIVSTLVFGLVPALRIVRGDLQQTLREGGKTSLASARDRVRTVLIAGEVAIALTLLVGAGLLIRTAMYLNTVDPGFKADGLVMARVALRPAPDAEAAASEAEQTFLRIVDALKAQPGIAAAAVTTQAPLGAGGGSNGLVREGGTFPKDVVDARSRMVTPGYLAAMGIPLLRGRDIGPEDVKGGLRVMVLSAAAAKALWPNEDPIGKRVSCCEGSEDDPRYKTVIGIAGDVRTAGPLQDVSPEFYIPIVQAPPIAWRWVNRTMTLVARAKNGDATSIAPTLRTAVKSVDPTLPVWNVFTIGDRIKASMAESRFHLMLLVTLGCVGLVLAAAGIYSVIAYFVALRTHEIGVRMALGATSRDVVRLLTLQGLRPVVIGAIAGSIAALWATRLLANSLRGVRTSDPTTFIAVTAVLLLVALVAILIPARRATAVDPTMALHG
jgi:predicted permease